MIDLTSIKDDIEKLRFLVDALRYFDQTKTIEISKATIALTMAKIMDITDDLATEEIDCDECQIETVNGESRFIIGGNKDDDSELLSAIILERDCLFCELHHVIEIEL